MPDFFCNIQHSGVAFRFQTEYKKNIQGTSARTIMCLLFCHFHYNRKFELENFISPEIVQSQGTCYSLTKNGKLRFVSAQTTVINFLAKSQKYLKECDSAETSIWKNRIYVTISKDIFRKIKIVSLNVRHSIHSIYLTLFRKFHS